jgi:hypothetical protein
MSDTTATLRRDFSGAAALGAGAPSVMLTETQAMAVLDSPRTSMLPRCVEI